MIPTRVDEYPVRSRKTKALVRYGDAGVAMAICDLILLLAASELASAAYHMVVHDIQRDWVHYAGIGLVVSAIIVPISHIRGCYKPPRMTDVGWQLVSLFLIWSGALGFLTLCVFALKIGSNFSRGGTLSFAAAALVSLVANRIFWSRYLAKGLSAGAFAARRIGIISDGSSFAVGRLASQLEHCGLEVERHITIPATGRNRDVARAVVEQALSAFRGSTVDEVIVSLSWRRVPLALTLTEGLRALPLPIRLILDPVTSEVAMRPSQVLGELMSVEMQRAPIGGFERAIKRSLDIGISIFALFALAPLLVMIAIAIKLDSRGPVLFRQKRHGFNSVPFKILKFRSMTVMEDGAVVTQAKRSDARVTEVGKWIRSTSIDELPQLWNVLRGEMSLVGPRPHAAAHDHYYEKLLGDYAYRQHVKPGLTGWAQVNGSRGETPTIESMARRVKLDIWYVNNWNVWLDLRILLLTAVKLFQSRQAY